MNQRAYGEKETILPKYIENKNVKWWKGSSFVESPSMKSHHLLLESRKYWAKNDDLLLADFQDAEAPIDKFKIRGA